MPCSDTQVVKLEHYRVVLTTELTQTNIANSHLPRVGLEVGDEVVSLNPTDNKTTKCRTVGTLSTDFHLEVFNYFFLTTPVQCQDKPAPQTNFEVRPTVRLFDAFKRTFQWLGD